MTLQGIGLGLRPPHYSHVLQNIPLVPWFEVVTENFMGISCGNGGRPRAVLEGIRSIWPVALHGVSLSVGSTDPLNKAYLNSLRELIRQIEPAVVSDHFCWTGVGGENLHDLLPLPFTQESIDHLVSRLHYVQEFLGRRILLENVSSYLTFEHSEMQEWEFVTEVSRRSGCGLLLDVNNVYVNSVNHGFDPEEYLRNVPAGIVGQMHLAGHQDMGAYLLDTHDRHVCDKVWELYSKAIEIFGAVPTLIEWDSEIPEFSVLECEAQRASNIQEKCFENHEGQLAYS